METWAWLAAYVLAFGLLQLVLYKYFQRESTPETTPASADRSRRAGADPRADDADEDTVRCRHCGAYNERHATITFCRHCVGPLN